MEPPNICSAKYTVKVFLIATLCLLFTYLYRVVGNEKELVLMLLMNASILGTYI